MASVQTDWLKFVDTHWRELIVVAGGAILAAGGALLWWRSKPRDPAEIERRRRAHLNQIGRIVEGQIVEIIELPAAVIPASRGLRFSRKKRARFPNGRKMICYSYSISGVSYETAQDITGLEERACLSRVVTGQPASVKYDPANPSDSILVTEDWSGLH